MSWAKLDDQFPEHPRIVQLTDKAFRVHVAGLCLAARRLTDGHLTTIDTKVVLAQVKGQKRHLNELVRGGLWELNSDGYVIRDYLDYNPTAQSVKERRKAEAERLRGIRAGAKTA